MIHRWFSQILGTNRSSRSMRRSSRRRQSACRLNLEILEDRTVPATLYVDSTPIISGAGLDQFTVNGGALISQGGLTLGTNLFTSINAAVAAAHSGDTIQVADGVYNETVMVDKTLHLLGVQAGVDARTRSGVETVVNHSNGDIVVQADFVTIDGFKLTGAVQTALGFNSGIWTNPAVGGGTQIHNNIIAGNYIGIYLNNDGTHSTEVRHNLFVDNTSVTIYSDLGLSHAEIAYNNFVRTTFVEDTWAIGVENAANNNIIVTGNDINNFGRGMYFTNTSSLTITGNDVFNVGATRYGIRLQGGNTDVDITFNDIENGGRGIWISNDIAVPNSGVEIHYNKLTGHSIAELAIDAGAVSGDVDASANFWGTTDPAAVLAKIDNPGAVPVDFTPLLNLDESIANHAVVGFQLDRSSLTAHTLGAQTTTTGRIQEAINLLADGSLTGSARLVVVDDGSYVGDVDVNKAGTLQTAHNVVINGNLTLSAAGVLLTPGPGAAQLTVNNFYAGASTATSLQLLSSAGPGNGYDQISAGGSVTIDAAANINVSLAPGFTPGVGDEFTLIDKTSAGAISGEYANLHDGAFITLNGVTFQADYQGGNGNDLTLTVTSVTPPSNQPPVNDLPGNQPVIAGGQILFSAANNNAISISDPDAGSGNVTVTLRVDVGVLTYAVNYGVAASGAGTSTLTFTGPIDRINKSLNTLFYVAPAAGGVATLRVTTNDNGNTGPGGARVDNDSISLYIEPAGSHRNAPPTITAPATQVVIPATAVAFNDANGNTVAVGDLDAGFDSVQVVLSASDGDIHIGSSAGISISGDGTGTVVVTGRVDLINYNLQNLSYTADAVFSGTDTLRISVNDLGNNGTGGAQVANRSIFLGVAGTPFDEPPVNTVPTAQTVSPSKALLFSIGNGNAIQFSDADAGTNNATMTLQVSAGTLYYATNYGVSATGYGTRTLTFTGTVEAINKTVNTLFYLAGPNPGSDTLTVTSRDNGNPGTLPAAGLSDMDRVTINIHDHANAGPTITLPAPQSVNAGGTLAFNDANSNSILVGDIDSGWDNVTVRLSVAHGILNLSTFVGASITGNGTRFVTIRGRIDHLNYSLQSLSYSPDSGYSGPDSLNVSINDEGRNGAGGARTAFATLPLTVN